MSRYIDADKFMGELNDAQIEFDENYKGLGKAKAMLSVQPTADVVEVVRCKDCEWYREVQGYEYKGRKAMCCLMHNGLRYETDYCNYGVRREDVNT